jgi:hypothetical protein
LNGFGNLPSATQRQTVAGLAGTKPFFPLVVATSDIRPTRCAIHAPKTHQHGMRLDVFFENHSKFVTCSTAD